MPTFYAYLPVENPSHPKHPQERRDVEAETEGEAIRLARQVLVSEGFVVKVGSPLKVFAVEAGSNKHFPISIDIFSIDPKLPTENGYCTSYSREFPNRKTYLDWEKEVATPALINAGFEPTWCWCDGEADSFGPLSRKTTAVKDDKHYEIWYG